MSLPTSPPGPFVSHLYHKTEKIAAHLVTRDREWSNTITQGMFKLQEFKLHNCIKIMPSSVDAMTWESKNLVIWSRMMKTGILWIGDFCTKESSWLRLSLSCCWMDGIKNYTQTLSLLLMRCFHCNNFGLFRDHKRFVNGGVIRKHPCWITT